MRHLWVLHRDSGICLFEQQFCPVDPGSQAEPLFLDSDLFTGFVSAIFSFTQHASGNVIDSMVLQDSVLYYRVSNLLIVVVLAPKTELATHIKQFLADVEREFLHDFRSAIESKLGSDVALYESFSVKIQRLLKVPVVLGSTDRTGELRDTLLRLMKSQISLDDACNNVLAIYDEVKGQENVQVAGAISAVGSVLKKVPVEARLSELVSKLEGEMAKWGSKLKLFVFGLDSAGKTSILNRLRGLPFEPTRPTLAVSVEQFEKKHLIFQSFDMAGQASLREAWAQYLPYSHALIFVIDYNEAGRFKEALGELLRILAVPYAKQLPILVFANKQDLFQQFESTKFISIFEMRKLTHNPWKVVPCSAKTGEGLEDGLKWLMDTILASLKGPAK